MTSGTNASYIILMNILNMVIKINCFFSAFSVSDKNCGIGFFPLFLIAFRLLPLLSFPQVRSKPGL